MMYFDESTLVGQVDHRGTVLRHYALADRWFKINVTTDRPQVIGVCPVLREPRYAFNAAGESSTIWPSASGSMSMIEQAHRREERKYEREEREYDRYRLDD
jgi:hypothetical protein